MLGKRRRPLLPEILANGLDRSRQRARVQDMSQVFSRLFGKPSADLALIKDLRLDVGDRFDLIIQDNPISSVRVQVRVCFGRSIEQPSAATINSKTAS
jgi:hypothetical protein